MDSLDLPKSAVMLASAFPVEYTGKIVKLALASLQPKPGDLQKHLQKLSTENNVPLEQLQDLIGVYISILKSFVFHNAKDFFALLQNTGFSSEFIEKLPFLDNRPQLIENYFAPNHDYFQNIISIKWRIDISLMNSNIVSKTVPNVILSIKMKNGKLHVIELNSKAFHMLRFNVALILKEMKALKSHKFVK